MVKLQNKLLYIFIILILLISSIIILFPLNNKKPKVYNNISIRVVYKDLYIYTKPDYNSKTRGLYRMDTKIITGDSINNGFVVVLKSDSTKLGWVRDFFTSEYNENENLSSQFKIIENERKKYLDNQKQYNNKLDSINNIIRKDKEIENIINKQFSKWDGSNIYLSKYIIDNMHDPSSYEHVETKYWIYDDYIVVKTTIRGNNKFGALVLSKFVAKINYHGKIYHVSQL